MRYETDKILEDICMGVVNEGKFTNALKMGALGAATLLGQPNVDASSSQETQKMYHYTSDVVPVDHFVELWGKYYQSESDPSKIKRAYSVLSKKYQIPADAKEGIRTAMKIFGGDMGVDSMTLVDVLTKTGEVESQYKTKVQYGGGPARGYWQVEPETALSLLRDSSPLFGKKFNEKFGQHNLKQIVQTKNLVELSNLLEKDVEFAASMAAAKWIVSASSFLKKYNN
jgi:hypothetical protein